MSRRNENQLIWEKYINEGQVDDFGIEVIPLPSNKTTVDSSTYGDDVVGEEDSDHQGRYSFFDALEQIRRQCDCLLAKNESEIASILNNGHDWAEEHTIKAKAYLDDVFDFFQNQTSYKD